MSLWEIIDKPLSLLEIKLEVEIKKYFQAADQRELDRECPKYPGTDELAALKQSCFKEGFIRARDIYRPAGFLKK